MLWKRRKLTPRFGIELSGQQLDAALPASEMQAVYAAVVEHGVAVVAGQSLRDEDLHRFATTLGDVAPTVVAIPGAESNPVGRLSNTDPDGKFLPEDAARMSEIRATRSWHIDSTYVRPRATISMLYGHVVPPVGGDTQFCDLRLAWEALPAPEQARLESLTASHSLLESMKRCGIELPPEARERLVPVERPLVAPHPETGRKALCIARHIASVTGMEDADAQKWVEGLIEWAAAPERCYSHRWTAGDLVLWDNRSVMHRATAYEMNRHERDMRSLRLQDPLDAAPGGGAGPQSG